jgi:hypothetical protein
LRHAGHQKGQASFGVFAVDLYDSDWLGLGAPHHLPEFHFYGSTVVSSTHTRDSGREITKIMQDVAAKASGFLLGAACLVILRGFRVWKSTLLQQQGGSAVAISGVNREQGIGLCGRRQVAGGTVNWSV